MANKFPKLIHVTVDSDDGREQWLQINEGGVFGAAEVGERRPCAIYQLVEVGTVTAEPKYVPPKRTR